MILKKYQVLSYKDKKSIYVSKHNEIYIYNIEDNSFELFFSFKSKGFKLAISKWFKLFRRLLRTDIRMGFNKNQEVLLIAYNQEIFELKNQQIISQHEIPRGNRPLNITKIEGIKGFEEGIFFGEYFGNPNKEEVHICKWTTNKIKNVYTFPKEKINHIHNLIPDTFNDCVWILVGDFENSAAIYRAKNNFEEVELIIGGKQIYRSCVAFPTKQGLLYATDSQFEKNSIRLLHQKTNGEWDTKELYTINGPCIFGTTIKDKYVFSTSVEAINNGNIFQKMLRRKRGPGVLKNQSEVVIGNLNLGFKKVYTNKKDIWPFMLFQFGNILFPSGKNMTDKLIFTNIGLVDYDYSTQIIETTPSSESKV